MEKTPNMKPIPDILQSQWKWPRFEAGHQVIRTESKDFILNTQWIVLWLQKKIIHTQSSFNFSLKMSLETLKVLGTLHSNLKSSWSQLNGRAFKVYLISDSAIIWSQKINRWRHKIQIIRLQTKQITAHTM